MADQIATIADLDNQIATDVSDFETAAEVVKSVLLSLSAKIGTATPDLTPEVNKLQALDSAFAALSAAAQADDPIGAAVSATATVTPNTPSQTPPVTVITNAPATVADASATSDTAASTP